jgi:hypothetical protein
MSPERLRWVAAVLISLAFTVAAAPAGAAPAWLSPVGLSVPVDLSKVADGNAFPVKVAFDAQDTATAVWLRNDGQHYVVQAADRLAGGTWRSPVDNVSASEQLIKTPDAAFDAQGNGVAVWIAQAGKDDLVWAAFRSAGGGWQSPVKLSAAGIASLPHAALDAHGNAVAAWVAASGGKFVPKAAFRTAGGTWQTTPDLAPKPISNISVLQLALDAQGNGLVAWSGGGSPVQAAFRPSGAAAWQGPADVPGSNGLLEDAAFDAQGNALIVWTTAGAVAQAAFRPAGGAWQAVPDSLSSGGTATAPSVAFDPQGNAIAVWQHDGPKGSTVQAALRPAGGGWQQPALDLGPGQLAVPGVTFDAQGNALAFWSHQGDTGDNVVQAAFRPAGGAWQSARDVSTPGHYAYGNVAAFDGQGDALIVWQHSNAAMNGMVDVQAAGYDAAGPTLGGLSVPASGTAGQPLSFAVSPLDAWSALGGTQWTFGNDGTATGASVTHTFAAPGSYPVTVTGTDALGNTTKATRNVTIAAAPSQGVGGQSTSPPIVALPGSPVPVKTTNVTKHRCRVPSLKGRTTTEAIARLKKAKCPYSIKRLHSSKVPVRRVVSSRPSAGTTTTRVVVVDVSLGRRR